MKANDIERVAVIGAGLIGHAIAQEFALAGFDVALNSRKEETLRGALENVHANLDRLVTLGAVRSETAAAAPSRIRTTTSLEAACEDVDLVVEAVFEDLALKRSIFARLDSACPERAILASTTSTFVPSQYADATDRPGRVVGAHYFNPPYLVPLVEIIRGPATSEETVQVLLNLLKSIGKRPVLVRKEAIGFIGNRLQAALVREALWMVEDGVASPEDIDTVIRTSIGRRWAVAGLFETFDLGGWDVVQSAATNIVADLHSSVELPPILARKVEAGELGVKTGKGFYEWTPESAAELRSRLTRALVELEGWKANRR